MLIWQASSIILRAMIFTCIHLFLVFQCIGVKNRRKLCFWLIVIYTMIFRSATFVIETIPAYETSTTLQFAHMMIHAMHTFILLTIIGIFGTGYFPRNFISTEIYYDLLSAIPIMPMFVITDLLQQRFLPPSTERYIDCPAGCVISVICGVIGFLQIFALYYLLGKKINALLRKIPDNICLFLFLGSFAGFIIKQTLLLKTNTYYMDNPVTLHYVSTVSFTFNCALILASALIIILLTFTALQSRRLQYIQSLENSMLLSYYTNIASLHRSIRGMRHDLSNHLAALSFIGSGESAAGSCRQALISTSGSSGMPAEPGNFNLVEPGGCTPPGDPRRCAEASRRASCGAGALRAPEDPGRCAPGMPGDSTAPGSPAPAVSSYPRDSYRQSLLDVCSEIDRQIAAQTAWQQIETDRLSSREKYEIYHYVMTVMQKHRIPASALCIKTETGAGSLEILLRIGAGNDAEASRSSAPPAVPAAANSLRPKPLHLPFLRHGTMFRLIKLIAQSQGGDAAWKKNEGGYALIVTIRQRS